MVGIGIAIPGIGMVGISVRSKIGSSLWLIPKAKAATAAWQWPLCRLWIIAS